uniref:UPF3 domain-containing protein n=1 Tax=Moniliophthora roreri TaxID=221103 RepID=A0A0W0FBB7_MONRR
MSSASPAKPRREKEKKEKSQQQQGLEKLKIVIRRLPPNLPEDIFWQSVQNWVTDDTVTWKVYYRGKFRSRLNKENVPSRAYVAFKTEEQLTTFHREYDGHAVVEFAPYQKVPSDKKKADARNATIEQGILVVDEDYISFVQSLNQLTTEPTSIEVLIAASQAPPQPKTTPLLEALKAEKTAVKEAKESKEKMIIMRNHAAETRKEEAKKKAAAKATDSPPTSKKAKKAAAAEGAGRKGPKAPRVMREQQSASGQSPVMATKPVPASPSAAPSPSNETSTGAPTTAAPRRGRPILGLGSRQFEAALIGAAGVGAKAKKEREKEKQKEANKEKDQEEKSNEPSVSGFTSNPKEPPTSPKRDRTAKHKDNASASKVQAPVPSILQRNDAPAIILQPNKAPVAGKAPAEQGAAVPGPPPGFGRGRGRGRGRGGRGGPPPGRGAPV